MNKEDIEKQVIAKITPTQDYRQNIKEVVEEINQILKKEVEKRKLPATVELVGSIAKDTYLQNNMDIDFFLCFPTNFTKKNIAKYALEIGKSFLKDTEESYAEHPYLRGYFKKNLVEIVPCYKIENAKQKLSAVDRTPLHTKFVIENIKPNQKDQVRLFKQFLKGIGCYGAEAQIEGFSGYLCEILVLKYVSFGKLLKNASNWKYGHKLSIKKGKYPEFDTPLVFIDPVDSERNVASALSKEKFELFIKASKEYLKNPKMTFFFPNKIKEYSIDKIKNELEKQNELFTGVSFKKPDIIDENLYPQVRKAAKSVWDFCKRNDFIVYDVAYFIGKKEIYLIIKSDKKPLSKTFEHMGPPVKVKKNSEKFLNKWTNHPDVVKGPYEKDGRYFVEIKRQYTEINEYLKENIKNFSMGKHIDPIINKNYRLIEKKDLLKDSLKMFWTQYLDKKMSWEI